MVIGTNDKINIWNYEDNSIIKILSTNLIITGDCQYDFDKNTLYICAKNGITAEWDIENDKLGKYITKNNSFAFYCNNGKYIASYLNHILNSETGKLIYEIGNNAFPIKYSNKYYYTKDSIVYFGDYNNNQIIDSVNLHKRVRLFGFSDDGKYCSYSTYEDYSRFYIMNWDSKQVLYSDSIRVMKYSSDGKWAACRHSERNQILFVNLFEKKLIHIFETKYPTVSGFCFSADNKYFFINQLDSNIKMFDLNDLSLVKEFKTGTYPNSYSALAVTPDSKYLIEGSLQGEVRIWDIESGIIKHQYEKFNAKFETLDISPDSKYILAGYKDGTAILFNSRFGTTSIEDNIKNDSSNLSIIPNPSSDNLQLTIRNLENEIVEIKIINQEGLVNKTFSNIKINNNLEELNLNISELPAGVYIVNIMNSKINISNKTVKL